MHKLWRKGPARGVLEYSVSLPRAVKLFEQQTLDQTSYRYKDIYASVWPLLLTQFSAVGWLWVDQPKLMCGRYSRFQLGVSPVLHFSTGRPFSIPVSTKLLTVLRTSLCLQWWNATSKLSSRKSSPRFGRRNN